MSATKWQELSFSSHYQTAVAVEEALKRGDNEDAVAGIQELIDALARSEKRVLRSQLVRLMVHIIKWQTQPNMRTRSWRASIVHARHEIEDIREETPSLTKEVIVSMWDKCFATAKEEAKGEMDEETEVANLTWSDVFEKDYNLKD